MSALGRLWAGLTGKAPAVASPIPKAPADALGAATQFPVQGPGQSGINPLPPQSGVDRAAVPVALAGDLILPTAVMLSALGWQRQAEWATAMREPCRMYGINTRLRLAAFLANVGHETGGGVKLVESLNYDPAGLMRTWPSRFDAVLAQKLGRTPAHPADQRAIAEVAYGGRMGNAMPGEGWRYRGRGLMQLTGRSNYERFAKLAGVPLDDALLAALETPEGAARSAAHFWSVAGCNAVADKGDIAGVRRIVNGGQIGLDDVRVRYQKALAVI